MQYIKAKFLRNDKPIGRSYTYKADDSIKPGDVVVNVNGTKLLVIDEEISESWLRTYGEQNIAIVNKFVESEGH